MVVVVVVVVVVAAAVVVSLEDPLYQVCTFNHGWHLHGLRVIDKKPGEESNTVINTSVGGTVELIGSGLTPKLVSCIDSVDSYLTIEPCQITV